MSPTLKLWREALDELWRRRLRTGLTLLGLVFGVGSIVAMQGVGEGSRREALRLVEGLGLNNLIVEAISADGEALRERRERSLGLTRADARALLESVPGARAVAAEKAVRTHSLFSDSGAADAGIHGVSPAYFELSALALAQGRALSDADESAGAAVVVLGHQAARQLFPDGQPLGQWVKLNHAWFEVVGVLADRDLAGAQFEGVRLGLDSNRAFIPLASALLRFRFRPLEDEVDRVLLGFSTPEQVQRGAAVAAAVLSQRHAGVDDYRLLLPAQLFAQNQQTQRIFRIVMGAIAAVSLLVGGIGIMNIMLANVLERQREIGLLRALGARRRDVVAQFMRETAVVCIAGAGLGLLFGAALAYLIAALAGWQVAWSPLPVLAAASVCAAVGLAFGVYPARRAAALDPIAALRTE